MNLRQVLCLFVVLLATPCFAQQAKGAGKVTYYPAQPISPVQPSEPSVPMPLIMPLFLEGYQFSSTLTLVNNSMANTYADVTLRAMGGSVIGSRRVKFSPHSQQRILIGELLAEKNSTATSGSILIMQSSALAGPSIAGVLSMTYYGSADPNYIDEEPSVLSVLGSQVLQGVADRANGSPYVAISSFSKTPQHVQVQCLGEYGAIASKQTTLEPGETSIIDACDEQSAQGLTIGNALERMDISLHSPVGIKLNSDATPGSFAAFALTPHLKNGDGYLSNVLLTDPKTVNSSKIIFAGVPVGNSPLLPEGNFTPHLNLTNFSSSAIHVKVTLAATAESEPKTNEVGSLTVPPGSSRELVLSGLNGSASLQNSFVVSSDGAPGSLVAKLVSLSDSRLHEVELQAKDESDASNAGMHPWSIEQSTESTLLLFNHSDTPQYFDISISSGGIGWNKTYKLAAMQTKAISLRELVDDQVKDEKGKVLPRTA